MSTVQTSTPKTSTPPPQRSWVARHKILTSLGVFLVVALVGFYFLGWPLVKLRFHSQYAATLAEVRKSPLAIERLGEPIDPVRPFPGGSAFDDGKSGEVRLNFPVSGPKGAAEVTAFARMFQGQWDFTQLKLAFPNREEIDLTQGIQNRDGNSLPAFDPNAKQPDFAPPNLPLNIDLPEIPNETKK